MVLVRSYLRSRIPTITSKRLLPIASSSKFSGAIYFHNSSYLMYDEYNNPRYSQKGEWSRLWDILEHDWRRIKRKAAEQKYDYYKRKNLSYPMRAVMQYELWPIEADFFIVGGGLMGSCMAWWLKQRSRDEDCRVVVVESDKTFNENSTSLSLGAIRTQFSNRELVEMSLFGAEFLRNAGEHLRILDNDPPKIDFTPMGHLFLCNDQEKAQRMEKAVNMQVECGAKVVVFNRDELRQRFPFMNFDDVLIGTMGLENEGIVDAWQLLSAFREKNLTLGVQYVKGRVVSFEYEKTEDMQNYAMFRHGLEEQWRFSHMTSAVVVPEMCDAAPRPIRTSIVLNCAGPWASEVAGMAGLGSGPRRSYMSLPIPVVKRKRYVFVVHCPNGPGIDMPFVIDPSGVWCRRDSVNGDIYLCGKTPTEEEDETVIDHSNLDVDYNFFDERIWPVLAKRMPAFEAVKVKNAWAGYYDYNWFDKAPIIGAHLANQRFFSMCGFNGTGLQHAIAVGRAAMESWYDGAYLEINLRPYGGERMMTNRKFEEDYVI